MLGGAKMSRSKGRLTLVLIWFGFFVGHNLNVSAQSKLRGWIGTGILKHPSRRHCRIWVFSRANYAVLLREQKKR